jgi:hypothetical protein
MESKLEFREIGKIKPEELKTESYYHVRLTPSEFWSAKEATLYLYHDGNFSNINGRRIGFSYITHILMPCKEVDTSELREKFLNECTDVYGDEAQRKSRVVSIRPDKVFEWFRPYITNYTLCNPVLFNFKHYDSMGIIVSEIPAVSKMCDCKRQFDLTAKFACDGNCR